MAGLRRRSQQERRRGAARGRRARVVPLILDVTDGEQIAAAAKQIDAEVENGLDGLVNNAGIGVPGPLETMPIEALPPPGRGQSDRPRRGHPGDAAIDPSRPRPHCLHQLDRRPHRLSARRRLPRRQVRHRGRRRRLPAGAATRWEISVSIVEPGSIDTPIWERGERDARRGRASAAPEREALYGEAIERLPQGRQAASPSAESHPRRSRALIEHALSARRPRSRYLVGLDVKVQAR